MHQLFNFHLNYTQIFWTRRCRKSSFVLLLLFPFARITRDCENFIPFFWYQPVQLTMAHPCDTFVFSRIHRLSSKTTKTKSPYMLYRRPLAAGQRHSVPPGNRGEHSYRSLPSYTNTSLQLFISFLVVLLSISVCLAARLASTLGPRGLVYTSIKIN